MEIARHKFRSLLGACLVLCSHTGVSAQVRGVVLGEGGSPLPAAQVEIWSAVERLAVTSADHSGRFQLPPEATRGMQRLTISHLGYRVISLGASSYAAGELRIQLEPLPLPLPELTVSVVRQMCPNIETQEARRLWDEARRRYSQETGGRAVSTDMLRLEEGLLPEAAVGWVAEERLRPARRAWAGGTPTPQHGRYIDINTRIAANGYAFRTDLSEPPWRFPAFDERDAHHFASDLFGSLHSISIQAQIAATGETVLTFCPHDQRRLGMEGILRIAEDLSFIEAEWTVVTPRPVRRAGGHVVFSSWSSEGDSLPHLLPERGTSWVQHPRWSDRYSQRYTVYKAWRIGSDGALPLRGSR